MHQPQAGGHVVEVYHGHGAGRHGEGGAAAAASVIHAAAIPAGGWRERSCSVDAAISRRQGDAPATATTRWGPIAAATSRGGGSGWTA